MHPNISDSNNNRRLVLPFALIIIFGVGALFFSVTSSAQRPINSNYVIGNSNIAPEPPKTTVRGRIVYEDSGRPVRRTTVMLMSSKGRGGGEKTALTNDMGEFVVRDVEAGGYFPMINAPGVLNFLAFMDFSAANSGEGQEKAMEQARLHFEEIIVPAGGGEIDVYLRARRGGAVGGRVMYANGDPAIGVRVEVMRKDDEKYMGVISNLGAFAAMMFGNDGLGGRTDDRGVYRVSGLPPGEYIVRVTEPSVHNDDKDFGSGRFGYMEVGVFSSMITTFHPQTNDIKEAAVLAVEPGQDLSEINITIPERALYKIEGKIIAKGTRKPVEGARINIVRKDSTVSVFDRMVEERGNYTSDNEGKWRLTEFPAGTYTVVVKPPQSYGGGDYDEDGKPKPNQTPKPKFAAVEKEIIITDKDLTELTIEMPFGASIAGAVTAEGDKPANSLRVKAVNEKGEQLASVQPYAYDDKTKSFRQTMEFKLENLSAGKVFLEAEANIYGYEKDVPGKPIFYVKSIKSGGKDFLAAPFEVGEGAAISGVQITLASDGGRIKGTVKGKDDIPALNRRIVLIPVEQTRWQARSQRLFAITDNKGEFTVEGAPLEYFVIFITDKDKLSTINETWIRERSSGAEKATIKASGETTVNLTVP